MNSYDADNEKTRQNKENHATQSVIFSIFHTYMYCKCWKNASGAETQIAVGTLIRIQTWLAKCHLPEFPYSLMKWHVKVGIARLLVKCTRNMCDLISSINYHFWIKSHQNLGIKNGAYCFMWAVCEVVCIHHPNYQAAVMNIQHINTYFIITSIRDRITND